MALYGVVLAPRALAQNGAVLQNPASSGCNSPVFNGIRNSDLGSLNPAKEKTLHFFSSKVSSRVSPMRDGPFLGLPSLDKPETTIEKSKQAALHFLDQRLQALLKDMAAVFFFTIASGTLRICHYPLFFEVEKGWDNVP
ncbi:hypothetical protein Gotur_027090 [Gossypium turneri]